MKAIVRETYGPPEVLHLEEVPLPNVGDGNVLVRVQAASVNAGDWHLLRGTPLPFRLIAGLRKPKFKIIGNDIAGRVEAVGRQVTQFRPGDHVFGELSLRLRCIRGIRGRTGEGAGVEPCQPVVREAAAIPTAGCTALQGLRKGRIERARRVLINGASGDVGTFAVQIAKTFGPEVTAVCSTRNIEVVRSIGDALLFGPVLSMGRHKLGNLLMKPNQADLLFLKELCEAGKVRP